jgi:quinol monooxygenase YgiN
MFIAIVDFRTAPSDRPVARAQLDLERPAVLTMPGCVDFRVFDSGEDPGGLTVLHEWTDEASFAGYLRSDEFAQSGEVIRPLMTEPPVSRRFHAELAELVN